jgi:hypothetical protein
MNKWVELLVGLILVLVPIVIAGLSKNWMPWDIWNDAGIFLRGGLFWLIVGIGALFILLGISDLKE